MRPAAAVACVRVAGPAIYTEHDFELLHVAAAHRHPGLILSSHDDGALLSHLFKGGGEAHVDHVAAVDADELAGSEPYFEIGQGQIAEIGLCFGKDAGVVAFGLEVDHVVEIEQHHPTVFVYRQFEQLPGPVTHTGVLTLTGGDVGEIVKIHAGALLLAGPPDLDDLDQLHPVGHVDHHGHGRRRLRRTRRRFQEKGNLAAAFFRMQLCHFRPYHLPDTHPQDAASDNVERHHAIAAVEPNDTGVEFFQLVLEGFQTRLHSGFRLAGQSLRPSSTILHDARPK